MRIAITGGRDYIPTKSQYNFIRHCLPKDAKYYMGDCPTGVDHLIRKFLIKQGRYVKVYIADWDKFGKSAGPKRNKLMIETSMPDLLIAFPGGRGTEDCVRHAKHIGTLVLRIDDKKQI